MGNFIRDLVIVVLGIIVTILLIRIGFLEQFLSVAQQGVYIGSLISGIFFTSVFTIAPASLALAELANTADPWAVAFWGALGACLGDLILFLFVRDVFVEDLNKVIRRKKIKKFFARFHFSAARWMAPVIGAIIIASPLPDELGLGLMGLAKTKIWQLMLITFVMNFIGILAIAWLVHAL